MAKIQGVVFSAGGSGADPNSIIDEGRPTSTAVLKFVARLCDLLGRNMELVDARENIGEAAGLMHWELVRCLKHGFYLLRT